jgi:lipopolysaccharide export LptBFGC system permease protein LptF
MKNRSERPGQGRGRRRRVSRLLTRYVGLEILKVFLLVLAIQELVFGIIFVIQAIQDFGFELDLLLPVFWITFGYALYYAIPISLLFATGLIYGRLIADREVAALKSFGVSHLELALAPALLGAALAAGCYFINGYLIPELRYARDNLGTLLLDQLRDIEDGYQKSFFLDHRKKNRIVIEQFRGGRFYDIWLFAQEPLQLAGAGGAGEDGDAPAATGGEKLDVEARAFPFILHAREGDVVERDTEEGRTLFLELRRVRILYDNDFRNRSERSDVLQSSTIYTIALPLHTDAKKRVFKAMDNPTLLAYNHENLEEHRRLSAAVAAGDASSEREMRKAWSLYVKGKAIYHRRLTFAAICFTFPVLTALIALALNSTNRLLPFFAGTVVNCALFFPLEMQGHELAKDWNQPWVEHLGNIVLWVVGAGLVWRLERWGRRTARGGPPPAAPPPRGAPA